MNRIFQTLLAAALLLVAAPYPAQAATPEPPATATFETVDQVKLVTHVGKIVVKGVLAGQSTPSEFRYSFFDQAGAGDCQKQAILAMDRPGRYFLTIEQNTSGYGYDCTLTRR